MNISKLVLLVKHLWFDASKVRRIITPDMLVRLTRRVAASEGRHTGQIRIYVEASLPMSYVWRLGTKTPLKALIRQRAVMIFSKLRLWDTEQNNGVLIYLQLTERAIEIVADRGVNRQLSQQQWKAIADRMSSAFREGHFEDGLTEAIGEVSAVLVEFFPAAPDGQAPNELPDEPVVG